MTHRKQQKIMNGGIIVCLFAWGLTALSAQNRLYRAITVG